MLQILQEHKLRCKGEKCEMGMMSVMVLDNIVTVDGINMGERSQGHRLSDAIPEVGA